MRKVSIGVEPEYAQTLPVRWAIAWRPAPVLQGSCSVRRVATDGRTHGTVAQPRGAACLNARRIQGERPLCNLGNPRIEG